MISVHANPYRMIQRVYVLFRRAMEREYEAGSTDTLCCLIFGCMPIKVGETHYH